MEEAIRVVETIATITMVTTEETDGEDIEKTARRYNLGRQKNPKNLLQAAKGAR